MAIQLTGQNGGTWTQASTDEFGAGGNAIRFAAGYSAVTGNTLTVRIRIGTPALSATKATVYIYDGTAPGSPFVAMSSEFDVTVTGDKIVSITPRTLLLGHTYSLVLQPNTGFMNVTTNNGGGGACSQNLVANFPYRKPPPVLPSVDSTAGHEFLIWIDGTLGLSVLAQPFGSDNDPNNPPALVKMSDAILPATKVVDPINNLPILVGLSTATISTGVLIPTP